jgi:hypothetical protein
MFKEIYKYKVVLSSEAGETEIMVWHADSHPFTHIYFSDVQTNPEVTEVAAGTPYYVVRLNMSHYPRYIDLLRHEKPVFMNISGNPLIARVQTHTELPGDEDKG